MDIVIERGKIAKLEDLPEYSISIDGFTQGPKMDVEHHRYSFDHHSGCSRFCTTAACIQSWTAVLLGLDPTNYTIYANDVDADVCMSIWCLQNPDRCGEPLVAKLVNAIGMSDMFLGAINVNGMSKVINWICAPEVDSKQNGDYEKISNEGLNSILECILHRIDLYVNGEATVEISKYHKTHEFKITQNENGYAVVESNDSHVYSALWQSGINAVVVYRKLNDGSLAVSLAKKSDFIENFDLNKIYMELNKVEQGWGGSNLCGGAPRNSDGSRSKLSLEKIIEIIDSTI